MENLESHFIVQVFKKGDVTLPQNYRPISLLPVGYKVLATLFHQRLLDSGVDSKICSSQYGFRARRNCSDVLMIVRRMIDAAYESKHEGLMMVFLDWAKALDRIRSDSLVKALERFGFSPKVVSIIGAIYKGREFFVQDHSGSSTIHQQQAGIAQGCPLSPFLFIVVQSVMFHDIYARLHLLREPPFVTSRELLYAGDTVLMSSSQANLQLLIDAVSEEGAAYGLEINWEKTF